ncbi:hypothetical protein M2475_000443 [Breznakia sp. PF5-3]|uniref:hypothetical protein n=1 Tax=unclassified Breznakia TaxID=2623764 RepID=UPI002406C0C6|nr:MULTISPECIES: hypothetical protein [unclassified Breznakia]MDF9824043.1 hypothetical protein [Breznakia sp. PM6-1]MDF9834891.1 hypothetical protein [Breznakia sp. PF5-3]MDF9837087.1 hypothetical protein [Breznakia sp. PFB2-8]MDF9859012.1 hypothetical protein [Breznakia sp. PH5-24]
MGTLIVYCQSTGKELFRKKCSHDFERSERPYKVNFDVVIPLTNENWYYRLEYISGKETLVSEDCCFNGNYENHCSFICNDLTLRF